MKPKHWIGHLRTIRTTHDAGGPALGIVAGMGATPGEALAALKGDAELFLQREAAADLEAAEKEWEKDAARWKAHHEPRPLSEYHPPKPGRAPATPLRRSGSSRSWMSV